METFLEPVTVIGLNLLKEELTKKLQEKLDMENHLANLQNQIKETRNMIEVIDLGNKLVFKEYQKMGTENTVNIPLYQYFSSSLKEIIFQRISPMVLLSKKLMMTKTTSIA